MIVLGNSYVDAIWKPPNIRIINVNYNLSILNKNFIDLLLNNVKTYSPYKLC